MKQLILLIAIFLVTLASWAQEIAQDTQQLSSPAPDTLKQARIYISMGVAFPTGAFKSQFVTVDRINGAKMGEIIAVGYSYDLHRLIAVGASVGLRVNEADAEAYLKRFNAQRISHQKLEEAKSGLWKTGFLVADFYVQMPFKNIVLYSKISYGLAYIEHPSNYLRYQEQIYTHHEGREIEWDAAPVLATAYGFAGGLRYELGKFGIGVEITWFATEPNFKLIYSKPFEYEQNEKYHMNSNNCLLQLSYRL